VVIVVKKIAIRVIFTVLYKLNIQHRSIAAMSKVNAVIGLATSACIMMYIHHLAGVSSERENGLPPTSEWKLVFSTSATKDLEKLRAQKKSSNVDEIIAVLKKDPYDTSIKGQQFHKIKKYAQSSRPIYSRRVDDHNRVSYSVDNSSKTVHVYRVQGHYERSGR